MPSQGPYSPGTLANAGEGSFAWSNPANAGASDDAYASVTGLTISQNSEWLKVTNFGFNIGSDKTIVGIKVEVEKHGSPYDDDPVTGSNFAMDFGARLVKAGTIQIPTSSSPNLWPTSDTVEAYGGEGDTWNGSWTPADINNSGFGFAIRAINSGFDDLLQGYPPDYAEAYIDHIRITVYYIDPLTEQVACNDSFAVIFRKDLTEQVVPSESFTANASLATEEQAAPSELFGVNKNSDAFGEQAAPSESFSVLKIPGAAQARSRDRIEPYYLVEIALGGGGPTLRFSDRNITVDGVLYEDYLGSLSGLGSQIRREGTGGLNADLTLRFKNDPWASYTRLVEAGGTYPFEGALVTISEVYLVDGIFSLPEVLFKGALDEPQDIDLMGFSARVSSMEYHRDRLYMHPVIDEATWPNAHEDLGKVEPVIYGDAGLVPAQRVDWGARTTLVAAITAAQTAGITLSDKSRFPASGSLWINDEKIAYTSIDSAGVLGGVSRAQGGTTASAHGKGATCWEHQAYYDSLLAGHVCHSVVDIFAQIGGRLLRVLSGVTVDQSSGKCILRASEQIKVIEETDEGSHQHPYTRQVNQFSTNLPVAAVEAWPEGGSYSSVEIPFPATPGKQSANYNIEYSINVFGYLAQNESVGISIGGITVYHSSYPSSPNNIYRLSPLKFAQDAPSDSVLITVSRSAFAKISAEITILSAERNCDVNSDTISQPADGVRLIGGLMSTREVERFVARVKGYKDDGSGTITGVPGALIERPDHVIEHWLTVRMGFSSGEIDDSSFSTAGALYAAAISGGYKLAFALLDGAGGRETAMRLASECRSTLQYRGGKWYLAYIPDTAPAAKKTITKDELAGQNAGFRFGRTPVTELSNKLTARYAENYAPLDNASPWDGAIVASDSASITKYGTRPLDRDLRFVRLKAMAEHVLSHMLLERKAPLLIAEFPVFWEHFDLVPGDTIEIDNPLYGGRKFYIEEISRTDSGRATVRAIEWWA